MSWTKQRARLVFSEVHHDWMHAIVPALDEAIVQRIDRIAVIVDANRLLGRPVFDGRPAEETGVASDIGNCAHLVRLQEIDQPLEPVIEDRLLVVVHPEGFDTRGCYPLDFCSQSVQGHGTERSLIVLDPSDQKLSPSAASCRLAQMVAD